MYFAESSSSRAHTAREGNVWHCLPFKVAETVPTRGFVTFFFYFCWRDGDVLVAGAPRLLGEVYTHVKKSVSFTRQTIATCLFNAVVVSKKLEGLHFVVENENFFGWKIAWWDDRIVNSSWINVRMKNLSRPRYLLPPSPPPNRRRSSSPPSLSILLPLRPSVVRDS